MKRDRGYHLLFGLTLMALAALGSWWTVFFMRSVEVESQAQRRELVHATLIAALRLGHGDQEPKLGPLAGFDELEVVDSSQARTAEIIAPAVPNFPNRAVRPSLDILKALEVKAQRRRFMLIGEGGLLFALIGLCTFMLYRLVRQERRHMRDMEDLVASVTHEMKTPLTGIKSMLQTFVAGNVPDHQKVRLYAMGLKEAERLEHMVENILISGRMRGGHLEVCNEPIDLRPLLEGFVEHRRRYLVGQPNALQLFWDTTRPKLRVMGDSQALRIVLENLTDNAIKYGGESPQVVLRVQDQIGGARVSVEDQGIGFDPEEADQLFVPFRRVPEGKSAVQHGTGLGLSIARALVKRMGGELTAFSQGPGSGSRFSVSLKEAAS